MLTLTQDLVKDLDTLPKWPDKVKLMQEHWLGRSPGAVLDFEIDGGKEVRLLAYRHAGSQ